jgi:hypothetical protein
VFDAETPEKVVIELLDACTETVGTLSRSWPAN